jgi:hypothetical protein
LLPDKNVMCHHTGFKMACFKGVTEHSCPKWIHITGTDPATGQSVDKYGCSDSFMHMLMIENTMVQHQTGAAVDSFRNEMLKLNGVSQAPQVALLN